MAEARRQIETLREHLDQSEAAAIEARQSAEAERAEAQERLAEAERQTAKEAQEVAEARRQIETLQAGFDAEREALKNHLSASLNEQETRFIEQLTEQAQAFRSSRSWRLTAPLRATGSIARAPRNATLSLRAAMAELGGIRASLATGMRIMRTCGPSGFLKRLRQLMNGGYRTTPNPILPSGGDDFVNHMAAERKDVLLSDWHIALSRALSDDSPSREQGPSLGLSIVTYNSARWLPGFFESLLKQDFPLSRLNVAIVDHESQDETVALILAHADLHGDRYASFTLHMRPNLGFGAGHDYAIRQLVDDFVLVTNVDLCFHNDTLRRALRSARADRADIAAWELRQCPYEHPKYYDPVTLEAVWNSHACVLMRRRAYIEVGGYDDRLFMYGEDVELSYRFRGAGWRLRYLPQISVTHFVDLNDTSLRSNQLSGSLAANILLRYRYGGTAAGEEGTRLLEEALAVEHNPARRASMIEAQRRVSEHKHHFCTVFRPTHSAHFPFSGFDYVFSRDGASIVLDSSKPAGNETLVTVITRTWGPKIGILGEALTSVINQSYPNIEHIVVEDRTDFAAELVAQVAEAYGRNIRYLKSDGTGRSESGNFGMSNASGEAMMLLDNDDLLFCEHVELLLRALMVAPDAAATYALAWDVQTRFDDDGNYTEVAHILPSGHRLPYQRKRLYETNFIPIQAIMFRRDVFEAEGGFNPSIDHLEDWNLWSRYSNYGPFQMVSKLTSMYRTPADPEIRRRRQADLDNAYRRVKSINATQRR